MGLLTILFFLIFHPQVFGFAIAPRDEFETLANDGLDKYQEPSTLKIAYHHESVHGYLFHGNSTFDLPQTMGMIYQSYSRKAVGSTVRLSRQGVQERIVAYVIAEKATLVLGIPLNNKLTEEARSAKIRDRNKRNIAVMEHILKLPAQMKTHYPNSEPKDETPTVEGILSYVRAHCGQIKGAGVMTLRAASSGAFKSPVTYDAVGLGIYTMLGAVPTAWKALTDNIDSQPFLAWATQEQRRVLRLSIASEVIWKWEEGSEPVYRDIGQAPSEFYQPTSRDRKGGKKPEPQDPIECQMEVDEDPNQMDLDNDSNENNAPARPPSLQEIFHVKTGKNKGGCDARQDTLRDWFDEVKKMIDAGLQAFSDADNGNKIAADTLEQFLGITSATSADERKETKMLLVDIRDFCTGELDLDSGTPWLFCGSTWLEQKKREDPSQEPDGSIKHDSRNRPLKIQDDPLYQAYMWAKNQKGKKVPTTWVPYWSSDLEMYYFAEDYENKGYCAFTGNLGGASYEMSPSTMNLCPKAFSAKDMAQKLGSRRAVSAHLRDVYPRSSTLFHEMFHLVHTGDSPDASYELGSILKALESPEHVPKTTNLDEPDSTDLDEQNESQLTNLQLIRQNPETWVYFCMSYWFTLNQKVYFPKGQKGVSIG